MRTLNALTLSEVRGVIEEIQRIIQPLVTGNLDLKGRRITNTGGAISPFDYVRKFDLDSAIQDLRAEAGLASTPDRTALTQDISGDFLISGNYKFRSGTSFIETLDHAATADRTITLPDDTGTLVYDTAALTANNIILGSGTSKVAPLGALGTTITVLHGNAAGAPTFGAVSLTADVTGVLPIANGGTAGNSAAAARTALGFANGVYTPTLTGVANVAASTAYQCQYLQIGDVVVVSGKVDVDPTALSAYTELGISLPVASNLGAAEDCGGSATSLTVAAVTSQSALIGGDPTNNRAVLAFDSLDTTNESFFFIFMYRVI